MHNNLTANAFAYGHARCEMRRCSRVLAKQSFSNRLGPATHLARTTKCRGLTFNSSHKASTQITNQYPRYTTSLDCCSTSFPWIHVPTILQGTGHHRGNADASYLRPKCSQPSLRDCSYLLQSSGGFLHTSAMPDSKGDLARLRQQHMIMIKRM